MKTLFSLAVVMTFVAIYTFSKHTGNATPWDMVLAIWYGN